MSEATASVMATRNAAARCENCRFRRDDRHAVEQQIPGLRSFGSAFGASMALSRLCDVHDAWVSPQDSCTSFSPRP